MNTNYFQVPLNTKEIFNAQYFQFDECKSKIKNDQIFNGEQKKFCQKIQNKNQLHILLTIKVNVMKD